MRLIHLWIRRSRKSGGRVGALLAVLAATALLTGFWQGVNDCLRPAVEVMAVSSAVNRMTKLINNAVEQCVRENHFTYDDFISQTVDDGGRVTSLTSDLASVSRLKSRTTDILVEELDALREEEFGIPLGTLTGWIIFSGKGPAVRVELLSVGDQIIQLRHEFHAAGINQTLHQIFLDISVTAHLMIPGEVLSETVETSVCVAETVLMGAVPDTYLNIRNGD